MTVGETSKIPGTHGSARGCSWICMTETVSTAIARDHPFRMVMLKRKAEVVLVRSAVRKEPRLSIAADCSTPRCRRKFNCACLRLWILSFFRLSERTARHSFLFKRLRAQANGFLLQHTSSRSCMWGKEVDSHAAVEELHPPV